MRNLLARSVALVAAGGAAWVSLSAANAPRPGIDWPTYRGIQAAGISEGKPMPTSWSLPEKKGIKWSAPIAGLGHSSPIIWGDSLCVTTAISGRADVTTDGADAQIDKLAKKYLGKDEYPWRKPEEQRIKVRIKPDHVDSYGFDS